MSNQNADPPEDRSNPRCYLIGEGNLLIKCANLLLEKNCVLLGIMSHDAKLKEWASEHHIYHTNCIKSFEKKLENSAFDYIFSIINRYILPQSVLKKPRQFVINYHDGPLPRYAGSHATSWAILHNEKYHGITWHIASDIIDAGDILKQRIFPLDPDETAFSLNLKCYEQAISGFDELLDELFANTVKRKRQDLSKRHFFHASKKPNGSGFLNWGDSADHIYALHRALNFGEYPNPITLPKIIWRGQIVIPHQMSILEEASDQLAGTILEADGDGIKVSTSTKNIKLCCLTDLLGKKINPYDFFQDHKNLKYAMLDSPSKELMQEINKKNNNIDKYESLFVKKFYSHAELGLQPFVAQDQHCEKKFSKREKINHVAVGDLCSCFKNEFDAEIVAIALIVIYLYRISNHQELTIYIRNKKIPKELSSIFYSFIPYTLKFTASDSFECILHKIKKELDDLKKFDGYTSDIFLRYPELRNINTIGWSIDIVDDLDGYQPAHQSSIILAFSRKQLAFCLFSFGSIIYGCPEILATKISSHINNLIASILQDNQAAISSLSIIPPEELNEILITRNQTRNNALYDNLIHEIFEAQAIDNEDRIAITCGDKCLTYQELNQKANQLAQYLKKHLSVSKALVAIFLDRSTEVIISILGILKAGAAYIPIDINHPQEHVKKILNKDISIILTEEKLRHSLGACLSYEKINPCIITIDSDWPYIQKEDNINLGCLKTFKDIAYVIYTSGSTGEPKGVLIEHCSVINLAYSQIRIFNISKESRILGFASPSFDASISEIFCTLFAGAMLYIAKKNEILPGSILIDTLQKNKITVATIPPVVLEMTDYCESLYLKTLVTAGEACSSQVNKKWNREQLLFVNAYGPTEATVCTSVKICSDKNKKPTIGKPIDNVQVYVLDKYLQPVPIGVVGELYIGGMGIARGYFNKPELTAQKFIPNPFSKNPNDKIYKSGDLVRWLPDGDMEYIGRIDQQVKIRGHRVELGDVEVNIQSLPFVKRCIATVSVDSDGHKQLVAYIVPSNHCKNLENIREYLIDSMPDYMIPKLFFILNELPISTNGKVDIKALFSVSKPLRALDFIGVSPKTKTESALAKIWSECFHVKKIGVNGNFFKLGGDSLQITEILLKIKKLFHISISIKEFFDNPTIIDLAKLIDNQKKITTDNPLNLSFLHDALLDNYIALDTISLSSEATIKNVLLTGATGFFGVHLLHNLHHLTTARIYCLVRAKNTHEAMDKINKNLLKYRLNDIINSNRIIPLLGDVSKKNLGLLEDDFRALSKEIDSIYYSAAFVNHLYNYEMLKPINVMGAIEIIRFATTGKIKNLHYISTIGAAIFNDKEPIIKEKYADEKTRPLDLDNGYLQTKWASERLLAQAASYGLPVYIYRPGWIGGQLYTGICDAENNHFLRLIKTCLQFQCAPNKLLKLDILPVDFLSFAITKISLDRKKIGNVFNFSNPYTPTWQELIAWLNSQGFTLDFVSDSTWLDRCFSNLDKENALFPFAHLYFNNQNMGWLTSHEKMPTIESHRTLTQLESLGIKYPKIDNLIMKTYFQYLNEINFLKEPSVRKQENHPPKYFLYPLE